MYKIIENELFANSQTGLYKTEKEKDKLKKSIYEDENIDKNAFFNDIDDIYLDDESEKVGEIKGSYFNFKMISKAIITIDFRELVFNTIDLEMNKYYDCFFIKGNQCYFSRDPKTGIFLYFTRDKDFVCTPLTLIDIVQIVFGIQNGLHAVLYIAYLFGLNITMEGYVKILEKQQMYLNNIKILQNLEKINPFVYKAVKSSIPMLIELNKLGLKNINEYKGNHFSVSSTYLEGNKNIGKTNSTIKKDINNLSLIHVIEKVSLNDKGVDSTVINYALKGSEGVNRNSTNILVINDLEKDMSKIEAKYKQKKELKITQKFTREELVEKLGEEEAHRVFPIFGDKEMKLLRSKFVSKKQVEEVVEEEEEYDIDSLIPLF